MIETVNRIPFRQALYVLFALTVIGDTGAELISEFRSGSETLTSMFDDLLMFVLGTVVLVLFGIDHLAQRRALDELRDQLQNPSGQLAQLDSNSTLIANQYRNIMQKQFDQWKLTTSEQDVVLALLKGLSFREVAELRETKEKTVRQQATSVYKKAGVAGRHELAAWFFEDMLEPPPSSNESTPWH